MQYVLKDAEANVLCPATKLWNTGHGAKMLREAVSLMGGYGITEDCPGFLGNKWMDAQLEATYEGPEAVQRRQLTVTMTSDVSWPSSAPGSPRCGASPARPGTGACTLASAMQMWLWTLEHLQKATDPSGGKLYHGQRQGVTFPLADALCWLVASRARFSMCSNWKQGPQTIRSPPKVWKAPCSSSATSATRRRRGGRRGLAASAPSWSSATTAIPPGTRRNIAVASWPASWKNWKERCQASAPWPLM